MRLSDFDYHLPPELIAQMPALGRDTSRLLVVPKGEGSFCHQQFNNLTQLLQPHDLLVVNDTQVIKARLFGRKTTGGQVECLVERITDSVCAIGFIRASRTPKPGTLIEIEQGHIEVIEKQGKRYRLRFKVPMGLNAYLEQFGEVPLPPYLKRAAHADDSSGYQTVYAAKPGAVAAPTAGLHFTLNLLEQLQSRGVEIGKLTLHVGAGTFLPVEADEVEHHTMHSEWLSVSEALVQQIARTQQQGGRVIAVGTTSARALETAARSAGRGERAQGMQPFEGESRLFIYPGFEFKCIDGLITNFHLPKSTLLMLVSALAGVDQTRRAYDEAITHRYRFYSYGDAMFIQP